MQLFKLIRADLSSYRPRPKLEYENGFADASTSAFDPVGTSEPHFPKSLYLLQPIFSAYQLNPVAPEAQASIPVPEGLDLDAWIVPQAKPAVREPVEGQDGQKKRRDKKGKAKDTGSSVRNLRKNGKKKAKDTDPAVAVSVEATESEERAKV